MEGRDNDKFDLRRPDQPGDTPSRSRIHRRRLQAVPEATVGVSAPPSLAPSPPRRTAGKPLRTGFVARVQVPVTTPAASAQTPTRVELDWNEQLEDDRATTPAAPNADPQHVSVVAPRRQRRRDEGALRRLAKQRVAAPIALALALTAILIVTTGAFRAGSRSENNSVPSSTAQDAPRLAAVALATWSLTTKTHGQSAHAPGRQRHVAAPRPAARRSAQTAHSSSARVAAASRTHPSGASSYTATRSEVAASAPRFTSAPTGKKSGAPPCYPDQIGCGLGAPVQ
jgi:hypothetical protein